jgi:hypothetical protein
VPADQLDGPLKEGPFVKILTPAKAVPVQIAPAAREILKTPITTEVVGLLLFTLTHGNLLQEGFMSCI